MAQIAKWTHGNNTLIQEVVFDSDGEEIQTTLMSGKEATSELESVVWSTSSPLLIENGSIYGYVDGSHNRIEYWDCEDQTYSDYVAENNL